MAESAGNEQIFHLFFTVCVILCYNTYGDIMSYTVMTTSVIIPGIIT